MELGQTVCKQSPTDVRCYYKLDGSDIRSVDLNGVNSVKELLHRIGEPSLIHRVRVMIGDAAFGDDTFGNIVAIATLNPTTVIQIATVNGWNSGVHVFDLAHYYADPNPTRMIRCRFEICRFNINPKIILTAAITINRGNRWDTISLPASVIKQFGLTEQQRKTIVSARNTTLSKIIIFEPQLRIMMSFQRPDGTTEYRSEFCNASCLADEWAALPKEYNPLPPPQQLPNGSTAIILPPIGHDPKHPTADQVVGEAVSIGETLLRKLNCHINNEQGRLEIDEDLPLDD